MTAEGDEGAVPRAATMSRSELLAEVEAIRDWHALYGTLTIGDVEILLWLAVSDYDMSSGEIAANVRRLLIDEDVSDFFPDKVQPLRPPRPAPLGPLTRIDSYECEADKLRVEVERVPGADDLAVEARMQSEVGAPQCPECEREMALVGRKLRRSA